VKALVNRVHNGLDGALHCLHPTIQWPRFLLSQLVEARDAQYGLDRRDMEEIEILQLLFLLHKRKKKAV
jgi:hypothetical protein